MKTMTLATGLAAVLASATPAFGKGRVTIETFGSNKGILGELKAGTGVTETADVEYFGRLRLFRGYDGKNRTFMNNVLSAGEVLGFRILGQARLVKDEIVPYGGVSRSFHGDDWNIYAEATSSIQEVPTGEVLVNGSYSLGNLFAFEVEQIAALNEQVWNASSRAHLGLKLSPGVMVGVAGEVDYAKDLPTETKVGGYFRLGGL